MSSEDGLETHAEFDYHDCDTVTFSSSDNVLFNLHRTNLRITAGIFPGPEFDASGEVIPLQETEDVLAVLFQFVYPERRPKLPKPLGFNLLAQIAEAAEKYQIFAAIDACEARFEVFLPEYATPILVHALKHERKELIDKSAFFLSTIPISVVLREGFPPHLAVQWSKYHEDCREVLFKHTEQNLLLHTTEKGHQHSCALGVINWMHSALKYFTLSEILDSESPMYMPDMQQHIKHSPSCSYGPDESGISVCPVVREGMRNMELGMLEIQRSSFSQTYLKLGSGT